MSDLKTKIGSLELEHPVMLASGILDENGYTIKRILEEGAAAAVTKSIGNEERNGYIPPVVVENESYIINAMGLPNPGIEIYEEEIHIAKKAGKPVIGSIFAADSNGFLSLAERMTDYGVDAIELNLSCPHVKGFGTEVGSDPVLVKEIVKELKGSIDIPIWSKLSPNVTSILDIGQAASESDALVLINTVRAMAIDIYAKKPVLTNIYGGMSGPAIKSVGIRMVYEIKKELDVEVVGVGGIQNGYDALEYIMAGASAVQVGTAVWKYGRGIFKNIKEEMTQFMESNGIKRIDDIVGVAVQ
ncbi:dihydroorotate dehydrogenase [Cuniculiplasma sp. SKW3]|uniref:dihydroorotate dehydrogenase n=1 Tax=unclassified Cuniculiplasma TaxID=2619706 RepID=UPI003FD379FE